MSKLILCSGERTKRPYVFGSTGVRIYSMEELCYYLNNHVYMIEEDMFREELFDWIDLELKLSERAQKLRLLKKQGADVKTIVTVILCSTDYYTEAEIKSVLKVLDEIIGMPTIKRNYIKANTLLHNQQYKEAAAEYERLMNSKEIIQISPEEYGDVYHNLAIAKLHVTGLKEASKLLLHAYERNGKEASLKQYLISLRLIGSTQEYENKIQEFQVREELRNEIEDHLKRMEEEVNSHDEMKQIDQLRQIKAQGKISEFYQMATEHIETWKTRIRHV